MRTTVTLDPDVYAQLREAAHRQRNSFKAVLNDAIRRGLNAQSPAGKGLEPYVVKPHAVGLHPGVDYSKVSQFLDDLEVEDRVASMARDR
jgi:hypothetical protein